jgi:hypothetical protein
VINVNGDDNDDDDFNDADSLDSMVSTLHDTPLEYVLCT